MKRKLFKCEKCDRNFYAYQNEIILSLKCFIGMVDDEELNKNIKNTIRKIKKYGLKDIKQENTLLNNCPSCDEGMYFSEERINNFRKNNPDWYDWEEDFKNNDSNYEWFKVLDEQKRSLYKK